VPDWVAAGDFWDEKVILIWADNVLWAGPGRSTTAHHVANFEPMFQIWSSVSFDLFGFFPISPFKLKKLSPFERNLTEWYWWF